MNGEELGSMPLLARRLLDLPATYCVADDVEREKVIEQIAQSRLAKGVVKKALAGATIDALEEVYEWMDLNESTEDAERLLWLVSLVDALDLLPSDPGWRRPERLMRRLGRIGSFRMASDRMWACRFLADMPDCAAQVIPALFKVVDVDPDVRVRAWAAVALWSLGNRDREWREYVNDLAVARDFQLREGGVQIALDGAKARLLVK